MRIIWRRLFLFILLVSAGDFVIGSVCRYCYFNTNDTPTAKLRYTLGSTHEDILVLGSSRAAFHFDSNIIKDSTGLTTYNCGVGGADFQFSEIQLKETLKRYKPKLIVLEVSPNTFFLAKGKERLKLLLPYYKRDTLIYQALTKGSIFEKIKFISSIYPYNSTIGASFRGLFKKNIDTLNGFSPLEGKLDSVQEVKYINEHYRDRKLTGEGLATVQRIIDSCLRNKIILVVVSTPVYYKNKNYIELEEGIKKFCSSYNGKIHFLDYTGFEKTAGKKEYFYDNFHLDGPGARIFTKKVSIDLFDILHEKQVH